MIPSVASFLTDRDKDGKYTTEIRTSFTFVNVEKIESFAQFFVQTRGTDENPAKATQKAIDAIPSQLTFEIRKVPEFQLRTGILEVHGGEVVIEFGRDMGVKVGDEYLIMRSRVLKSGKQVSDEKGLIVVRRVEEEISTATVVYSNGAPQEGEQLQELPRVGIERRCTAGGSALGPWFTSFRLPPLARGPGRARARVLGLPPLRVRRDAPPPALGSGRYGGIPLNVSLGGEYNLYLGRLQLVPIARSREWRLALKRTRASSSSRTSAAPRAPVTYLFNAGRQARRGGRCGRVARQARPLPATTRGCSAGPGIVGEVLIQEVVMRRTLPLLLDRRPGARLPRAAPPREAAPPRPRRAAREGVRGSGPRRVAARRDEQGEDGRGAGRP